MLVGCTAIDPDDVETVPIPSLILEEDTPVIDQESVLVLPERIYWGDAVNEEMTGEDVVVVLVA